MKHRVHVGLVGLGALAAAHIATLSALGEPRPDGMTPQSASSVQGAMRLHVVNTVPAFAARRMPPGGRTCFYGETRVSQGSESPSRLLLHFFEWSARSSSREGATSHCRIDVYVKTASQKRFELSSTITDVGNDLPTGLGMPVQFADLMWLDTKRTVPMIRICRQETGGYHTGQNIFLTFVQGLHHRPHVQDFVNYDTHDLLINWYFSGVDQSGYCRFAQLIPGPIAEASDLDAAGDQAYWWVWNLRRECFEKQASRPRSLSLGAGHP
jgi:hypothetical protein